MGLRAEASAKLDLTLEDTNYFGWPITVTDPNGLSESLTGSSTDIAQVIDPDTGAVVSGRAASVTLKIETLTGLGFADIPRAIAETAGKPWVISFDDINGNSFTFKVKESNPDRAIGLVVCHLELYTP